MFGLRFYRLSVLIIFCICSLFPFSSNAAKLRVLAVMSYEIDFPWCENIKQGIDSVLSDSCEIKYFYMNTKSNLKEGSKKAEQAFELYKKFQPDGVIAADDNAQSMFVVPYLKDKVKTPVMFCGVNALPEKYGYPASNVSGILERPHFNESIALAKQLVPSIKTFGFIIKASPTGEAHLSQIQRESDTYQAKLTEFKTPVTVKELVEMTKELREKSDTLFVASLAGVVDEQGKPLSEEDGVKIALKTFGSKPTIGDEDYTVKFGALCTVVRTGQEQGETAAAMLVKAMTGTPVSDIPVTSNHKGKRVINATVIKDLGITPRPEILRGAEIVRTGE